MKKFIYVLLGVFWAGLSMAQVISPATNSASGSTGITSLTVSLSDLQTPASPGFVLADQTPSSVNRPTNPKGFVASLLSLNNGGALEVTPYWIIRSPSRDELSYIDYIRKRVPFRQTFSLSATSFRSDTGSYLSAGVRTTLVRVYAKKVTDKAEEIETLLSVLPQDLDTAAIRKAKRELDELDNRPKFVIELAGAILGYSPANGYDQLRRSRLGGWANIAYKPHDRINVIGLLRYVNNSLQADFSQEANLFDAGLGLGVENKQGTLTLNAEYVHRKNYLTKAQSHRLALVGNYKLTEQLYFVGSLGKNFDQVSNIIALFGINVGLSSSKVKLN